MVSGKFDYGIEPEFCLTIARADVHVNPFFLTGEEEKSVTAFPEYGGAHVRSRTRYTCIYTLESKP